MDSFFAPLQQNVLDHQGWATREELRLASVTWIERTHHRKRRQRALGRLTRSSLRQFNRLHSRPENQPASQHQSRGSSELALH